MGGKAPNIELRRILEEVGWSPYELARRINRLVPADRRVHAKTPFAWRDRGTIPRDPLPAVVAGVLTEARGEIVTVDQLWPGRVPTVVWQPTVIDVCAGHWTAAGTVKLLGKVGYSGEGGPIYFPVSGSELTAIAPFWAFGHHPLPDTVPTGTSSVSSEFVDYLERDLAELRRLDDGHGGRLLKRAVELRLGQVSEVLRNCSFTTTLARRLFSVAGQMAQMVGWLAFDLGDNGLAQRMYLVGLRAAAAAGDRALGALILSCIAQQQAWRDRSGDAVSIMNTLIEVKQPMPPRVRALLAMRRARAFAAANMPTDTTRSLDRAFESLETATEEQDPQWVYWMTSAVLSSEAGRCYLLLGDRSRAEIHLSEGLSRVGNEATRDKVLYGLSLALAHMPGTSGAGSLEMVCHQAEQVLPLLSRVGSARCRELFDSVLTELRPHSRVIAVRELIDKATSLQRTGVC
ncbi:hypothetical protein [Nocardia testacea]|uniref:hypothetical protein n=1 Tax=Nocardia testacea TaxID=248551 RepID=UPI003A868423